MAESRRRRWPWLLGVVALLGAGAIWINAQLEPQRLAATVLGKAGEALQLRLAFSGTPDYAFRPEPRLVLPGFSATTLDGALLMSARRVEVSLPWSTITGGEPVITRVQLDAPLLDLPVLRRWLASRPPTPFRLPTLSRGIAVSDGEVRDVSWSLRALSLELPHLQTGHPANLHAQARYLSGSTALPFTLDALAATPGLASPLELKLQLQLDAGKQPEGAPAAPNPLAISLHGDYAWADPVFTLVADKLALVARSPIPSFEGNGRIEWAHSVNLSFEAVLSRWPQTWPKLPGKLANAGDKLPVHLVYRGKSDFSDAMQLSAAREGSQFEASFRLPEMQRWLAADAASPLPPLQGSLKTPALEFDGVELQGVEVEISESAGVDSAP